MAKKRKPKLVDLGKYMLAQGYSSIMYYQGLMDKWDDPKDIASRCASMLRDLNEIYCKVLFIWATTRSTFGSVCASNTLE